jgi:uncharacterized protein YraI
MSVSVPSIKAPVSGSTIGEAVTFAWAKAQGAVRYTIKVYSDVGTTLLITQNVGDVDNYTIQIPTRSAAYYWALIAYDAGGASASTVVDDYNFYVGPVSGGNEAVGGARKLVGYNMKFFIKDDGQTYSQLGLYTPDRYYKFRELSGDVVNNFGADSIATNLKLPPNSRWLTNRGVKFVSGDSGWTGAIVPQNTSTSEMMLRAIGKWIIPTVDYKIIDLRPDGQTTSASGWPTTAYLSAREEGWGKSVSSGDLTYSSGLVYYEQIWPNEDGSHIENAYQENLWYNLNSDFDDDILPSEMSLAAKPPGPPGEDDGGGTDGRSYNYIFLSDIYHDNIVTPANSRGVLNVVLEDLPNTYTPITTDYCKLSFCAAVDTVTPLCSLNITAALYNWTLDEDIVNFTRTGVTDSLDTVYSYSFPVSLITAGAYQWYIKRFTQLSFRIATSGLIGTDNTGVYGLKIRNVKLEVPCTTSLGDYAKVQLKPCGEISNASTNGIWVGRTNTYSTFSEGLSIAYGIGRPVQLKPSGSMGGLCYIGFTSPTATIDPSKNARVRIGLRDLVKGTTDSVLVLKAMDGASTLSTTVVSGTINGGFGPSTFRDYGFYVPITGLADNGVNFMLNLGAPVGTTGFERYIDVSYVMVDMPLTTRGDSTNIEFSLDDLPSSYTLSSSITGAIDVSFGFATDWTNAVQGKFPVIKTTVELNQGGAAIFSTTTNELMLPWFTKRLYIPFAQSLITTVNNLKLKLNWQFYSDSPNLKVGKIILQYAKVQVKAQKSDFHIVDQDTGGRKVLDWFIKADGSIGFDLTTSGGTVKSYATSAGAITSGETAEIGVCYKTSDYCRFYKNGLQIAAPVTDSIQINTPTTAPDVGTTHIMYNLPGELYTLYINRQHIESAANMLTLFRLGFEVPRIGHYVDFSDKFNTSGRNMLSELSDIQRVIEKGEGQFYFKSGSVKVKNV